MNKLAQSDRWDVFISHASEDKDSIARPLFEALTAMGIRVWFDESEIELGDSLSRTIDAGLSRSRFGIVILSISFFRKNWPEYELRGLIAKEMGRDKTILPIWHNISLEDLLSYSPPLADKLAMVSDGNILRLANRVASVVRPDLHAAIGRKVAYQKAIKMAVPSLISLDKIKLSGPKHVALPPRLLNRIRLLRAALLDVHPKSIEHWVGGFLADSHPTREVEIWETIAAIYLEATHNRTVSNEERKGIYSFALSNSFGLNPSPDKATDLSSETREILKSIVNEPIKLPTDGPWEGPTDFTPTTDKEDFNELSAGVHADLPAALATAAEMSIDEGIQEINRAIQESLDAFQSSHPTENLSIDRWLETVGRLSLDFGEDRAAPEGE